MTITPATAKQVRAALEFERRINLHRFPVDVSVADDLVVLEGEVESIAAKKLALEHAARVPGIRGVVDRLHVAPTEPRGDGAIRDSFVRTLSSEGEFANCTIRVRDGERLDTVREVTGDWTNELEIAVAGGVITLEGKMISLSHKRAAGVIAWWTPGVRDVVNAIELDPPERDSDEEIVEALTLVLEMDPLVDASQVRVRCRESCVTLEGYVAGDEQRRRAELDGWATFGVDKVDNRIELQS